MSSTHHQYSYYPTSPVPIHMPQKQSYYPAYPAYPQAQPSTYGRYSISPPEAPESVATSSSGGPSYAPSGSNSSYAGSASDYDYQSAPGSGASVDLLEYMGDRMGGAFDQMPLDRSLAKQAQTSGQLNAKTQELLELQRLAQSRLASIKLDFNDGMKAAKDVQRDLAWTQKRVTAINERAAKKYPEQYRTASQRYPAPVDY